MSKQILYMKKQVIKKKSKPEDTLVTILPNPVPVIQEMMISSIVMKCNKIVPKNNRNINIDATRDRLVEESCFIKKHMAIIPTPQSIDIFRRMMEENKFLDHSIPSSDTKNMIRFMNEIRRQKTETRLMNEKKRKDARIRIDKFIQHREKMLREGKWKYIQTNGDDRLYNIERKCFVRGYSTTHEYSIEYERRII